MTKSPDNTTQWWTVEPPDHGPEPVGAYDGYYPDRVAELYETVDCLTGTEACPLFADVRIIEESGNLRFNVPKRLVNTPEDGRWLLEVFGGRRWLKERDDYGEIRFLQNGTVLWVPHLFPFEDTDERGMPVIPDRERCEVTVSLEQMGRNIDKPLTVAIKTPKDEVSARESPDSYNPYNISYFTEFQSGGNPLRSDVVTYPEKRWASIWGYLAEKKRTISEVEYDAMLMGRVPFPEEFLAQDRPNAWYERESSGHTGPAFGTIWVPVDMLRSGIEADMSFPCFDIN